MNEEKKLFKFSLNQPTVIKLSFDEPKSDESKFGRWYLYGGIINQKAENFFAPKELHEKIKDLSPKKGDVISITKCAKENNGKLVVDWKVERITQKNNSTEKSDISPSVSPSVWEEKDRRMDAQSSFKSCAERISAMITANLLKTPWEVEEEYIKLASVVYQAIRNETFLIKKEKISSIPPTPLTSPTTSSTPSSNIPITLQNLLEKLEIYGFKTEEYQDFLRKTYNTDNFADLSVKYQQDLIYYLSEKLNFCLSTEKQIKKLSKNVLDNLLKSLNIQQKEHYTYKELNSIHEFLNEFLNE